jgi:hypothetical protein
VTFPVKQAFSIAFAVDRAEFITYVARRVFQRLGFNISGPGSSSAGCGPGATPSGTPTDGGSGGGEGRESQLLEIPLIPLQWSVWHPWDGIGRDARGDRGVRVPNRTAGVYEVIRQGERERLVIGKAADLRMRVRQALVKGKTRHSAGAKTREKEDTSRLLVRWAVTDRPAAAEEELHRRHIAEFGRLPRYTGHT